MGSGLPFSVPHPAENECRKFGSPLSFSLFLSPQLKRWRRWDFFSFLLQARLINEFGSKWPLSENGLKVAPRLRDPGSISRNLGPTLISIS